MVAWWIGQRMLLRRGRCSICRQNYVSALWSKRSQRGYSPNISFPRNGSTPFVRWQTCHAAEFVPKLPGFSPAPQADASCNSGVTKPGGD